MTTLTDNKVKSIQKVNSCAELKKINDQFSAEFEKERKALEAKLEKLQPILDLLSAPTSPSDVIIWIEKLINSVIKPLTDPIVKLEAQLEQQAKDKLAAFEAAHKKSSDFPNCSI